MTSDPDVQSVLDSYPEALKKALLDLRRLIRDIARHNGEIGELEETLKWGQPSFLTARPKTGTTIRIDRDTSQKGDYALYVNCQSSLVSEWRALFPHLVFGGDRSVHFRLSDPVPENELRQMITMALTYHSRKRKPAKA
ncbi:DUF1801 domain-containing protein [Roseibium marinum]|uniref:Uncharacterized protein DUF1801 n=1 Tax=Roseibium marinum TaxID=281252 RepID=A0A2S3UQJ3_9HYPH|nr:DUF1801 domain-containing protein [Roseibium marinum]POF29982.1 uncharacterized protein DUF1801 [Roseibium marinum]